MFNWFNRVIEDYDSENIDDCILDRITDLELRVLTLEAENVELTNCLYEVENRLQAQIDNIHPVTYNLTNYTLDK
jgi:hypothetical protein